MGAEMGSKPRDWRDHEGKGADREFLKRQSTTTKGTKSCSNLDKEENFLTVLKGDFENPTPQKDHWESDVAELPVCTCHTAWRASPARWGGNKEEKGEGGDAGRQDSQVM